MRINPVCNHPVVLEIYTDPTHMKVSHYRCPTCGEVDSEPFGVDIIRTRKAKFNDVVKAQGNTDYELSFKFAGTLAFTNGICPMCKKQVFKLNDDFTVTVDIEQGAQHFMKHPQEDRDKYRRRMTFLEK